MPLPYDDRRQAGRVLAEHLASYAHRSDTLVLALPRGGVPVAFEVAQALSLPLDLIIVRKLGFPGQPELAMGAIASGGVRVLNRELLDQALIEEDLIEDVAAREQQELQRRERAYRDDRPPPQVEGRQVIVIDDGLATGLTMLAAIQALRQRQAARLVVAVPVAPPETCDMLADEADEVVCPARPEMFGGVGRWYHDFAQTSDEEVRGLLARAWSEHPAQT